MSTTQNLSIRLQPGGFSFSIYNELEDDSFSWQDVVIEPGSDYNKRFEDRLLAEASLIDSYRKVIITLANNRYTVVPIGIDKETAMQMHTYAHTAEFPEVLLIDDDELNGIRYIYAIDEEIYHFLNRTFLEAEFHLHICTLNKYFIEKSKLGNNSKMIAHLTDKELDLLVYRYGRLLLANTYISDKTDDMIFFLMNTWVQAKLDTENDLLLLAGHKQMITDVTAQIDGCIGHIMPAIFPTALFKLGSDTIEAPWDMTVGILLK